jgi:transposase
MIVIGVDVHTHSLTAVAVDELGRAFAEHNGPVDEQVAAWARSLDAERLWALEDCRHVTRGLERTLVEAGERLVRVPPRLTAPQRRRGRVRVASPIRSTRSPSPELRYRNRCWTARAPARRRYTS